MFFLFLSPVQILHRGNVLQHLTEPTIFPSNNNVHPQHSHRNMTLTLNATCQTCAKACIATSSFYYILYLYLFSLPSPLLFPLQFFFSISNTAFPQQKSLCRGFVESLLLMIFSSDRVLSSSFFLFNNQ